MLSGLMAGNWTEFLFSIFIRLIVVFTALPLHEYAHGIVARRLGDHTAEYQGRLDLNPLHHFDPIGTTMLLLTGYGWAKPVPVNPRYFKDPKKGMSLTALAGPVSNLLLAWALLVLEKTIFYLIPASSFANVLNFAFTIMISTNISIAVFNLLPCPPLDGAKIFGVFLPDRIYWQVMRYERYIMFVLFAVIMFTPLLNGPLYWLTNTAFRGINFLSGFVDTIASLFR